MKKSEGQKLNPYLAAALRAEYKCKLIKRIPEEGDPPHPQGIIEEHYDDGSKRFTGPGGGVVCILSDGRAMVMPESKLTHQAEGLLINVALRMPDRPVEIGDVDEYKEEARAMLEALRTKSAPFFRALHDTLERLKRETPPTMWRHDDEQLLICIKDAAEDAGGIPPFSDIKTRWRKAKDKPSETSQHLIVPMRRAGFHWLCPAKKPRPHSTSPGD